MTVKKIYHEGLLGKKLGMTQIFADDGTCVPVTAIQLGPCYILDVKNRDKHGYSAVQLGFEPKKAQRLTMPEKGNFEKAGKGGFYHVREVRCDVESLGWTERGKELRAADVFSAGDHVDVMGTSLGRGFAGVVKRYHVHGHPSTRGTHEYRRHIGAVGERKFPGRIFKNKHMPGHMGNERVTIQNLTVVKVENEGNLVFVKGGIPGSKGGLVVVCKSTRGVVTPHKAEAAKSAAGKAA
jgi:large subunit ribosomal protein L3